VTPRTLDGLRGLRAARWVRESTAGQHDRFGPEAQRDQQDRAIERHGLADTGLCWSVAHSGRTISRTGQWADMMAAAGDRYDVLVVGYVSRFARDLRTAVNARHELHDRGACILFADERVLSSDEEAWEQWAREAVEAEAYSRRLARRVTEGYAAKFRRDRDPGGNPPFGFRRVEGRMEPDPDTIGQAVAVFRRYATGTASLVDMESESGIDREALKAMLRNPIYNGWVQRHRRKADATVSEAAWRSDPPVPDALWARVQEVREDRYKGGGHPHPRHVHMLAGRVFCPCGTRIRAEAWKTGRRYRHYRPCPEWRRNTTLARRLEDPISAQVMGMRFRPEHIESLGRMYATDDEPANVVSLRRRQVERDLEELARRHAHRAIATDAYLVEHERLSRLLDAEPASRSRYASPDEAVRMLRDMRGSWADGSDEAKREVAAALYQRITATDAGIMEVELTPDAIRHGFLWAMPERVLVRPEGFGPPVTRTIPIKGRHEWLASVEAAS